LALDN